MTELQSLSRLAIDKASKLIGVAGELRWLPVDELFIDPSYQRPIGKRGASNIKQVANGFHWSLFSPLVVAARGTKRFAIIDGQHRATAAASRGDIASLPCLVITGDAGIEAKAFAAINGFVTRMSALSLFRAEAASGDAEARHLIEVCAGAGVTILPYPEAHCGIGKTMAVGTLRQCIKRFGDEVLDLALRMVTETGNGNAGMLREGIIAGGCDVLAAHPKWRGAPVIAAVNKATILSIYNAALKRKGEKGAASGSFRLYYSGALSERLKDALGDGGSIVQTIRNGGLRDHTGRRFTGKPKKDPASLTHLTASHPAIRENRTLFQKSVVDPKDSERLLISGANSVKLGKQVLKGEWSGFPIFQLSLEERASCPPTCNNRLTCYGNAMPFARRHRHGPELVKHLRAELADLQDRNPQGFVVRLHVLGDFYDMAYVKSWSDFLDNFPALHVFGYTAWAKDTNVGHALLKLSQAQWSRFAIRFSADASQPQGATTIWRKPEAATVKEGIVCPAQSDQTACCATCGLCWSAGARDKTIVFVGHGGINHGGRKPAEAPQILRKSGGPARIGGGIAANVAQPMATVIAAVKPPPAAKIPQRRIIEATGLAKEIVAYLSRSGIDVEPLANNRFRYAGQHLDFDQLVDRANRQRMIEGLPKLKAG